VRLGFTLPTSDRVPAQTRSRPSPGERKSSATTASGWQSAASTRSNRGRPTPLATGCPRPSRRPSIRSTRSRSSPVRPAASASERACSSSPGIPFDVIAEMFAGIRATAHETGRDPDPLELVVGANVCLTAVPDDHRPPFTGTPELLAAAREGRRPRSSSSMSPSTPRSARSTICSAGWSCSTGSSNPGYHSARPLRSILDAVVEAPVPAPD